MNNPGKAYNNKFRLKSLPGFDGPVHVNTICVTKAA